MANKAYYSSEGLVLGPSGNWKMHLSFMKRFQNLDNDLIISPPIQKNIFIIFFSKNVFVLSWEALSKKPLSMHALEGSTMYSDYFEMIVHNYNKITTLIHNNFV